MLQGRPTGQPARPRKFHYPELQDKPCEGLQLRSLECSSVQEVQPTNQSHEISWLEKLVTNIDDQRGAEHDYRNFRRKYDYADSLGEGSKLTAAAPAGHRLAEQASSLRKHPQFRSRPWEAEIQLERKYRRNQATSSLLKTQNIGRPECEDKYYGHENASHSTSSGYGRIRKVNGLRQQPSNTQGSECKTRNQPVCEPKALEKHGCEPRPSYSHSNNFIQLGQSTSTEGTEQRRRYSSSHMGENALHSSSQKTQSSQVSKNYQVGTKTMTDQTRWKQTGKQPTSAQKREKEEQVKMDEMARRLNTVLQSISQKSKILSGLNTTDADPSKAPRLEQPEKTASRLKEDASQQEWKLRYLQQSTEYQAQSLKPRKQNERTIFSHAHSHSEQLSKKYETMKRSLGASKHVPHQIIIQESSSEVTSQVSPRTELLHRQMAAIFRKLDKLGLGELTKCNCSCEEINEELKYIFGGVLSKIKFKNERYDLKKFIDECRITVKDFSFEDLKQLLGENQMTKKPPYFRLNEKDVESQRFNTLTNYDNQSKRSSERSEVVKKYEFAEDAEPREARKSIPKVHWMAPEYRSIEIDRQQESGTERSEKSGLDLTYGKKSDMFGEPKINALTANNLNRRACPSTPAQKQSKQKIAPGKISLDKKQPRPVNKQNFSTVVPTKQRRDFETMCDNLNSKLNNYLTAISQKQVSGLKIPLQFSQLSKHWGAKA